MKNKQGDHDPDAMLELVFPHMWGKREAWAEYEPANEAQKSAYQELCAWVTNPENSGWFPDGFINGLALLIGPPGIGKSHITAAFYKSLLHFLSDDDSDWTALWVDAPSLMRWLPRAGEYWDYMDSLNKRELESSFDELSPFGRMVLTSWLFIDDLREPRNDAERQFIVDLFDARVRDKYEFDGCGVITSNLDADALRKAYGGRTFDRMNDGALWIPMNGKSLRRPQSLKIKREMEVNL